MPRIYDCFAFFNELDLLEIRLEELNQHVDYFVLIEAPVTFQGNPKPLYYLENRSRFRKHAGKIRHIVLDDLHCQPGAWEREWAQRDAFRRGLYDASPDDVVIVGDADEIVRSTTLEKIVAHRNFCFLEMELYAFFLNWRVSPWLKVFAGPWSVISAMPNINAPRHEEVEYLTRNGMDSSTHIIPNAGWHFSWMGGVERMLNKLDAFSHTEERVQAWRDPAFLAKKIKEKQFFDVAQLEVLELDQSFPEYVRRNRKHFERLGLLPPRMRKFGFRHLLPALAQR